MIVRHRYIEEGLYVPDHATGLIVGTFPSILIQQLKKIRDRDVDFYYGSADNYFWSDLEFVYNRALETAWTSEAVEQRKQLLHDAGLGITDIILACETEGGVADQSLTIHAKNEDIIKLLNDHPSIDTLFFTSSHADKLTMQLLTQMKLISKVKIVKRQAPKLREFVYEGRDMKSITLYSPSPLAKRGGVTDGVRRAQYKQYLPAINLTK